MRLHLRTLPPAAPVALALALAVGTAALPAALAQPAAAQQGASATSDERALEVLRAAERRYESLRSLCADFHQVVEVPLLDRRTVSEGRTCQRRPGLFFMRFTDPEGDVVVADGEFVWAYYPSMDARQVMKAPMSESGGRFDFHREFVEDPGRKYAATHRDTETVSGRVTDVVELVPRTPSPYRSATVWIDRETRLLRQVEIREENGNVRRVRLQDVELNPEVATSEFRFTPPEGTHVVTP